MKTVRTFMTHLFFYQTAINLGLKRAEILKSNDQCVYLLFFRILKTN